MQYIIPHYYKKFACIGGDCPASKQRVKKVSKCWQERTWLWQWKQSFAES